MKGRRLKSVWTDIITCEILVPTMYKVVHTSMFTREDGPRMQDTWRGGIDRRRRRTRKQRPSEWSRATYGHTRRGRRRCHVTHGECSSTTPWSLREVCSWRSITSTHTGSYVTERRRNSSEGRSKSTERNPYYHFHLEKYLGVCLWKKFFVSVTCTHKYSL